MSCWTHGTNYDQFWSTATTTGIHVTVDVEQGTLRGQQKVSVFLPITKYYSFGGIPYAKPPVGPLRFKDPEEPETWPGVRDAVGEEPIEPPKSRFRLRCSDWMYDHYRHGKRTEDCLYLDVDTPQINESGKPVIVWIHPLHFNREAAFGPQIFGVGHYMAEDVVLVTVRCRHNVLGFLCLDHEEVPGNAGLKDQVMALKWVQRNISKFGGDPNNITLYGYGITAAFVHYHLMSPLSEGLFHRVIIQGDCALNPHSYTTREIIIKKAFRISHVLGQEIGNTDELLKFLRALPVADLLVAAEQTHYPGEDVLYNRRPHVSQFVPCVEVSATNKNFLPVTPREMLKQGRFAKVPTIIGTTNCEELVWTKCCSILCHYSSSLSSCSKNSELVENLPKVVGYTAGSEESGEWAEEIKKFYFCHNSSTDEKKINNFCSSRNSTYHEIPDIFRQICYDYAYNIGFDDAVRMQLEHTEEPVYAFEFMLSRIKNPMDKLCKHCTPSKKNIAYNWLIKMWTTFAKTGDPNNETMDVTWEPTRKDSFCYLNITESLSLIREWIAEDRMKMWQHLFERYPEIREKYSHMYMRRVLTETEKYYMEPELQLLFNSED